MTRKSLGGIVTVLAILWSSAAFAVYQETETTVTDQGKPIPQQTITVTIKQPTGTTQTSTVVRMRIVQKKKSVRTDASGRLKVTYDDRLVDRATAIVEFGWYVPGRGVVTTDVPLSSLGSMPVDLSRPGTAPPGTIITSPGMPRYQGEFAGFYIGGQGSGTAWDQRITERIANTNIVTNRLADYRGAGGIGVVGGYDLGLGSGWSIGPVGSFNYIGQSNDHYFGVLFIGTHINWNATFGGKLGYRVNERIQLYGVGGVEFSNYDFRSNFTGPVLAINRTVTGWFAGGGVEYTQPDWRTANGQWAVFGQMTISEFCGDLFRMPAFSPGFDYRIASDQVRATAGFTFRPNWGAPPPP